MKSNRLLISIVMLALTGAPLGLGAHHVLASTSGAPQHSLSLATGGTLTIGTTQEPDTLNPYITQLVTTANILAGVMDTLLIYDSTQHLRPGLATAYSVSADGLTYTFHLRHGVTWQDGHPFTARDVVATWKIITNQKFGAYSTQGWDKITGIKTPDNYTVVMRTKEKYAPFLSYVAGNTLISPAGSIARGVNAFKENFGRHPIGTGPFSVARWASGQYVELIRNPHYWGHRPRLDKIMYKIVPNDNTLLIQLRTGEVQMADTSINVDTYQQVKSLPNVATILRPSMSWSHIDLKNVGFLMDTRVRQALDYATPTAQIIARLLHGLAVPSVADQAPGTLYYNPNIKPRPYDLKKAAQLLKEDGFKKGPNGILVKGGKPFTVEFWVVSGQQINQRVEQVVSASWRQLGLNVSNHQQDIKSIWGPTGYQFNRKMTAAFYSWSNVNDPDDAFYWASSQIPKTPTGSGGNAVGYFHPFSYQAQIDALTSAGAKELNSGKRKQIYFKLQALLHEQVPVIFMYWQKSVYTRPKNMTGFDPSPFNYGLLWNVQDWVLNR